jgi:hypothetical protein
MCKEFAILEKSRLYSLTVDIMHSLSDRAKKVLPIDPLGLKTKLYSHKGNR